MPQKQPILLEQRVPFVPGLRNNIKSQLKSSVLNGSSSSITTNLASRQPLSLSAITLTALTKLLIPTEHDYELETGLKSKSFFLLGNFELSRMEGLQLVIYFNKRRDKSGNAFHITTAQAAQTSV
ncbi:hypothetical protein GMDG_08358 [Pseudogymnoascus destructans 20631-21]|uniref:Uncharacterized protein n=1 Tax=Pseudogymnoascus destructans (strain ATCC MYA-4855 / 20631-21) TaxID=658429 RepID=L8G2D7_PSED2|nr:hypothetical protein GMDG_08358 [Pseudogymnoascus destructans 20631-21]